VATIARAASVAVAAVRGVVAAVMAAWMAVAAVVRAGLGEVSEGGGQVAEHGCRPTPGGWVMGDPGGRVAGGDSPVEGHALSRWGCLAQQHLDQGVQKQRPAGEGIGTPVTGGDVEEVDPDPGCP
jgi:hypothetical protein